MTDKTARSDSLNLRVTTDLKQRFKQAAKDQGLKKAAFLEKLLAEWRARNPAPATTAPAPAVRPIAKTAKKPGRAAPKRKA